MNLNRIIGALAIIGLGVMLYANYSKAKEAGKKIKIKQ